MRRVVITVGRREQWIGKKLFFFCAKFIVMRKSEGLEVRVIIGVQLIN